MYIKNKNLLKKIGNINDEYLEDIDVESVRLKQNKNKIIIKLAKYILAPVCIILIAFIGIYKSNILN